MTRSSSGSTTTLTSRDEFRVLTDLVLKHSKAEHTFLALHDGNAGTTRFANNQVIQNVNIRRVSLSITVANGQQHGTAGTTDLTAGEVRDTVTRAEAIARVSPPDPEYLAPVPPQHYSTFPTWRTETASSGPTRRLAEARTAIAVCRSEELTAAGIVATSDCVVGASANSGVFAYEPRTEARFSLTAIASGSTGWASALNRSVDRLQVPLRVQTAIAKAKRSANPKELPAGRYTVILEPAAVAGLVSRVIWMLDAKAYDTGTSPVTGKLGTALIDSRLTLQNNPEHPDGFGQGFTGEGLPCQACTWIDHGVLTQLAYDRFTAKQHGIDPIPTIEAPRLTGEGPAGSEIDDLISTTERGILVTNFWYIRTVNPTDLTLTGMTRDGTFLIEEGEIVSAVKNFRFHESPLRAFNQVENFTTPLEGWSVETGKMLVPAMRIRDFHFSSVTKF